ncbi:PR domain zinc finger protein 5 [Microdochium nivale]|nr:PR domain zinc finger protein 5 [Microdochium nivale]
MGQKKRGHPDVEEILSRAWCYYCERDFEDLKLLISHQKAKHFKCETCGRRLNTAGGLSVHMNQVHKESLTQVENALPNRQGLDVEIFGMEGIPEDIVQQHNQRIIQNFYQAQADRFAATGNPPAGQNENRPQKKIKMETADEIKKRLAEHRARLAAQKAANGGVAPPPPVPGTRSSAEQQSVSPSSFAQNSQFPPPGGQYPGYPQPSAPGYPTPPGGQYQPGYPTSSLPQRPGAGAGSGLPPRPGQQLPGWQQGAAHASTIDELVASAGRPADHVDDMIRNLEQGGAAAATGPAHAGGDAAPEKKSKKDKDKSVKMVYEDELSPEERMAMMPRYAYVQTAA